jgi:hypothetical protein
MWGDHGGYEEGRSEAWEGPAFIAVRGPVPASTFAMWLAIRPFNRVTIPLAVGQTDVMSNDAVGQGETIGNRYTQFSYRTDSGAPEIFITAAHAGFDSVGTIVFEEDDYSESTYSLDSGRIADTALGPDADGDGLSSGQQATLGTDRALWDTDGDGVPHYVEVAFNLNPLLPDADGTDDMAEMDEL